MKIESLIYGNTDELFKKTSEEKDQMAYIMGAAAFRDVVSGLSSFLTPQSMDEVDVAFDYGYAGVSVEYPDDDDLCVTLSNSDREKFTEGWNDAEEKYYIDSITDATEGKDNYKGDKIVNPKNKAKHKPLVKQMLAKQPRDKSLPPLEKPSKFTTAVATIEKFKSPYNPYSYLGYGYDSSLYDDDYKSPYTPYVYTEPALVYERFKKLDESKKKIVFPADISKLLWDVFQTASGKEIMFYGELTTTEAEPETYTVSGMNFPPQKNYGGYVETVDGPYETWIFNQIILKGKKIPLHVHTHPDFGAFSSAVDELQIKQYITDNAGNPFVAQLIISNPRKGTYFIRWFDLANNTWEKPTVEFNYDLYDIEKNYPGIFQFNAPRDYKPVTIDRSLYPSIYSYDDYGAILRGDADEDDPKSVDLMDREEYSEYLAKKYRNIKFEK